MAALDSLWRRLKSLTPGDEIAVAEIVKAMEKGIVDEDTSFDDAALLSKLLDDLARLTQAGAGADWKSFFAAIPAVKPTKNRKPGVEVDFEVLVSFVREAGGHLETMEGRLRSLIQDPSSVVEVFQAIHTIKGVAGYLHFQSIKILCDEIEVLLEDLRAGRRTAGTDLIEALVVGCRTLNDLVGQVQHSLSGLKPVKGLVHLVLDAPPLEDLIRTLRLHRESALQSREPDSTALVEASGEISELLQSPELVAKFAQEALETLEVVEGCLLTMEKTRSTGDYLNEAFRAIHTLKGNAGFFGLGALESLCMDMESVLDAVRKGQKPVNEETVQVLLEALDRLRGLVQSQGRPAPASLATFVEAVEPVQGPSAARPDAPKPETEGSAKYSIKKKDIRVDTEKLDQLFDLIGELITAEAMVIDNPELAGLDLESFPRAAAYLGKITRELQAVTMAIRMIPLEGLFSKMHRLVRDLGRKFGKDIELEISGAETEMDRNIIEEISDPLVHIIRNAMDHGIEDADRRKNKGKTPGGRIRLDARYEGNEIWITISDDGAGLNRDRIVEVARSRGLIGTEERTDAEVWKLIFEPGFSTAKEVSEISGRGVGMDVVKKNLEKLRGQIDIQTVTDQGTDFILKIPLTLAIIDGVTLRSGTTLYSIPIADVVEFQNYRPDQITQTDPEHRVLRLRDEVIPVLPLAELFAIPGAGGTQPSVNKRVSIVVKSQNRKMAMVVDEIVGYKQIVLKALPESMANLVGISGCTILGNGEVSLIIDVNALFSRYFG